MINKPQLSSEQMQELEQQARDLVSMFEHPGWEVIRAYALQKLQGADRALKQGGGMINDDRLRGRIDILEWITKGLYDNVEAARRAVNADPEVDEPLDGVGEPYSDPIIQP